MIRDDSRLTRASASRSDEYAMASGGHRMTLPLPALLPSRLASHTVCPATSQGSPGDSRPIDCRVMVPMSNGSPSYHSTDRSVMSLGSNPRRSTRLRAMQRAWSVSSVTVPAGFPHVPLPTISVRVACSAAIWSLDQNSTGRHSRRRDRGLDLGARTRCDVSRRG